MRSIVFLFATIILGMGAVHAQSTKLALGPSVVTMRYLAHLPLHLSRLSMKQRGTFLYKVARSIVP